MGVRPEKVDSRNRDRTQDCSNQLLGTAPTQYRTGKEPWATPMLTSIVSYLEGGGGGGGRVEDLALVSTASNSVYTNLAFSM